MTKFAPAIATAKVSELYYQYSERPWWHFFLYLMGAVLLLTYLSSSFLLSDDLIFEFYGDKLPFEKIENLIAAQRRWAWFIYPFQWCYYFIKVVIIGCILVAAAFFAGKNIRMSRALSIVIAAEVVFLIPLFIKFIWFGFFYRNYNLEELQFFMPLSIVHLMGLHQIPKWLLPAAASVNVFEVLYWIALSIGLSIEMKKPFANAFLLVMSSYGLAWLLLIVFVLFLTLNFS